MSATENFHFIKNNTSVQCFHLTMTADSYLIYCSDLLYFFARYLAEALLGILTKDSSLLYLVMLQGVSHTQKSLSLSTRKSAEKETRAQLDLLRSMRLWLYVAMGWCVCVCVFRICSLKIQTRHGPSVFLTECWVSTFFVQLGGAVGSVACNQSNTHLVSDIFYSSFSLTTSMI